MANIAIIITHNKTDNASQIEALKPLIEKKEELHDEFSDAGEIKMGP